MDERQACGSVRDEARVVADMLDSGRSADQAAQRLYNDFANLAPAQSRCLARQVTELDDKRYGDNATLMSTRNGDVVRIDAYDGSARIVPLPILPQMQIIEAPRRHDRDYDRDGDRRYQGQPRYGDPQGAVDPRYDGRHRQGQDPVTGAVVDGVIGGVAGAAIDNRKGAIAGGAGAIAGDVVRRNGGTGDRVTDTVVQGVTGAVVGAAIDGGKGAKAGAVGAILPGVLRGFFSGDQH
jgi:hypothetical protein